MELKFNIYKDAKEAIELLANKLIPLSKQGLKGRNKALDKLTYEYSKQVRRIKFYHKRGLITDNKLDQYLSWLESIQKTQESRLYWQRAKQLNK